MMYSKKHHPKPMPIIGYTTRTHLLLDFDNTTLTKVIKLCILIIKQYPKVGSALICLSSQKPYRQWLRYTSTAKPLICRSLPSYHAIFDNNIGYNTCGKIIETLAGLNILNEDYVKIRDFRGDMTLRISPMICTDEVKPMPKPKVYVRTRRCRKHDGMIIQYLKMLKIMYHMFGYKPPISACLSSRRIPVQ